MVAEVPGYVLRERIASSASATVWRGEALGAPGRVVAVKLVAHIRGGAEAVRREAELLARLSHPHVLPVLAVVATSDGVALVTPFASGGSLAGMLHRGSDGPHGSQGSPADAVAELGARLASALAAVHGAGIVHGDVRPSNVLFDRERRPLLADTGIARPHGDMRSLARNAPYHDPTLLDGSEPDARSDLYALGITLYEALAGVPPYIGETSAQTLAAAEHGRFVPLAERTQAPPALTTVIEAAFARDPRDRPAGVLEFAGHLDEARQRMGDAGPSPPAHATEGRAGVLGAVPGPTRTSRRTRRHQRHAQAADADPSSRQGSGTPSAPATADEDAATARHRRRMPIFVAAMAIVLVPAAITVASFGGDDPDTGDTEDAAATDSAVTEDAVTDNAADAAGADTPGDEPEAPDADAGTTTRPPVEPGSAREPAPPCEGLEAPDDGREILLADLEGTGCSAVIAWDGQRLDVLGLGGSVERYDLAARPGDLLRFGDWSCDGRDTPALYRPADGRLFTFDEIAPGARITATGTPTGTIDGTPTVVADAEGCERVEVAP